MSRRALPTYDFDPPPPPSKCAKVLHCIWKIITCVFSHAFLVTLVVAYCILGAFTFEHLEAENERKVKRGIVYIRSNMTEVLWQLVRDTPVLVQENWTEVVVSRLRVFETEILTAMKQDGWDGNEDENAIQWTFAGALFYSIIVITTIARM
ncbi:uncharacterized protein LOC113367024 [Ctenocephalides felis]|uniref:uncharacterized protein LOC113367024 n=1 Tax=Ctenocephalides felis TaxID=7515 RepID=UPI000E6E125F|nr:uncharacterized protein LOC113367024 [Ctenocephalides felis]